MITFDKDNSTFNYRVAGVAIHEGRVLLHRAAHEDFWTLPGGRCEMRELGAEALRREMIEELGAEVIVDRLLWVVENFFEYNGRLGHEIGLYYLMRFAGVLPPGWEQEDFRGTEEFDGNGMAFELIFHWYPLEELNRLPILPAFIAGRLSLPPGALEHIVQDNR